MTGLAKASRRAFYRSIRRVGMPSTSILQQDLANFYLLDAYATALPATSSHSARELANSFFEQPPRWVTALLWLRDRTFARLLHLESTTAIAEKTKKSHKETIGFFPVLAQRSDDREVVVGADDHHLNFRTSLLVRPASSSVAAGRTEAAEDMQQSEGHEAQGDDEVVVTTLIHTNNLAGRFYIFLIMPFHRLVVLSSLENAIGRMSKKE